MTMNESCPGANTKATTTIVTGSSSAMRRHDQHLLDAALTYAATGQAVFPCVSVGRRAKAPLTQRGVYDATLDPEEIRWLWGRHPLAAIGIPTGEPFFTVLDVDVKHGNGFPAFFRLRNAGLTNGAAQMVRTPSGGIHLFFRGGPHGNASLRECHVDLRGIGGYVLAAPSRIQTPDHAGQYRVIKEYHHEPLLLDWDACKALLQPPRSSLARQPLLSNNEHSLVGLSSFVLGLEPGGRNAGLFWAASRAAERGLDPMALVAAGVTVGLDDFEALATVESAVRRVALT